jgi:integrase
MSRPLPYRRPLPALIAAAGSRAQERFIEFFTANIRNRNTRRAYAQAVSEFLAWCEDRRVPSITAVQPVHVAGYVEELTRARSASTAKQRLSAIRHLFDWLVIGQVMPTNPASSVRGPSHVVKRGKTPVLSPEEARRVLDGIDVSTHAGLRDRALIALMVFSFARIGAAVFVQDRRLWVRLCARRAASAMKCRAITILRPICAPISTVAGSPPIPKGRCFAPSAARQASSPRRRYPRPTPTARRDEPR